MAVDLDAYNASSSDDSWESDLFGSSSGSGEGWRVEDELDNAAFPLDIYTAASIGHHNRVSTIVRR